MIGEEARLKTALTRLSDLATQMAVAAHDAGRLSRGTETALLEQLRPDAVLLPGVGQDWLAERDARAALLRPDRYIFAVAP